MKTKLTYLFIILLVPLCSFAFLPTLSYQNTSMIYGDVTRIRATATSQNSTYALQNIPTALVGHISVNINNGDINVEPTAPAGVYTITNRATDNSGLTDASFTLTINKAPLTITGQNKPSLTATHFLFVPQVIMALKMMIMQVRLQEFCFVTTEQPPLPLLALM